MREGTARTPGARDRRRRAARADRWRAARHARDRGSVAHASFRRPTTGIEEQRSADGGQSRPAEEPFERISVKRGSGARRIVAQGRGASGRRQTSSAAPSIARASLDVHVLVRIKASALRPPPSLGAPALNSAQRRPRRIRRRDCRSRSAPPRPRARREWTRVSASPSPCSMPATRSREQRHRKYTGAGSNSRRSSSLNSRRRISTIGERAQLLARERIADQLHPPPGIVDRRIAPPSSRRRSSPGSRCSSMPEAPCASAYSQSRVGSCSEFSK